MSSGVSRRLLENWKRTVSATTYETNKEEVDQTDAEKRADLFRVHLLRRRGLVTQVAPKRTMRPANRSVGSKGRKRVSLR
jgi:hypothetical protein